MADRYMLEQLTEGGTKALVSGEEAHHLLRVMRRGIGDPVTLLDRDGFLYSGVIRDVADGLVTVEVQSKQEAPGEPGVVVVLLQALCKADKMDLVIQKATELGAVAIRPVTTRRCDVKLDQDRASKKGQRWNRIAREAAKQCRRGRAPAVSLPVPLREALEETEPGDLLIVLWEGEDATGLRPVLRTSPQARRVFVVIGPEGGLTEEEVALVRDRGGVSVTLGPRILRTETAGLCALSCILYERGELE